MICFKTMNIGIFMICCFVCLWNTSQQLRTSRVPCTFFKLCSFVWDLVNMTQTPSVVIMIINDIYIYIFHNKKREWLIMEGLRFRDDSRFGGGFTRPHQTVCLHWNICFCLKVRIAELLMGPFLMGFPVFLLNSHTSYNIIEIISNNGYICWIWLFWDSFSLFYCFSLFP